MKNYRSASLLASWQPINQMPFKPDALRPLGITVAHGATGLRNQIIRDIPSNTLAGSTIIHAESSNEL